MEGKEIHNHFEKDSNCQVFQGPISGCVFAMPGSVVNMNKDVPKGAETMEDEGGARQDEAELPRGLKRDDVKLFLEKLKQADIVDENFKPKVSNRNASILADFIGTTFNIKSKWKDFGELWGMDKEVLRSTFNNITNNDEDKKFCKLLRKL